MTVTIVCDVLGEENNGTTIAAMNLIRSLREKGHTVRVVCSDKKRVGEEGFFVVPTFNLGILNGYVAKNGVALSKPVKSIIDKAIDGADVVHVMIPFALGVSAAKEAQKRGIPVTAGFHCQAENFSNHIFLMNSGLANRGIYRLFYHNLYSRCNAVHYPTRFICDTFEGVTRPTNHYVISNGVGSAFVRREAKRPKELCGKFVILFTGRYSREKSHKVLIDAVAKSAHKDEIRLIFAGSGPQAENIRERSRECGISMPVMKFFTREELVDVINYSDLYVHPAEIEIEAIACLEAIACGKVPVICDSPRSATRYFALGDNNLFRLNDASDLAKKIDYWIDNPDKRRECSEKYLGYAERFNFQSCMDRMEKMLLDAAEKKE